jgi:hypothetical protein
MGNYKDPDYHKKRWATPKYKESRRWRYIRYRYGVSKEQWQETFAIQEGKCAICGTHQSEIKKTLDTDHDHVTGKFRGLLCSRCNMKLGTLEDSAFVEKATVYLNKSKVRIA